MVFTDQMNEQCVLDSTPKRIVSLVPSQSELLWDLGLRENLVGITKFCIHPEEMFKSVTRVGGTKQLDIEKIRSLKPDLIIGNKEENAEEQIALLKKEFPVWMSDIFTVEDSLNMITAIGKITRAEKKADEITTQIGKNYSELTRSEKRLKVIYLIWNNPVMAAGKNTFIDNQLQCCGFINGTTDVRYPELTIEEMKKIKPDFLFLSSEPFPFHESHIEDFKAKLPETEIRIVDGEFFSWYGSRLIQAPCYFQDLLRTLS